MMIARLRKWWREITCIHEWRDPSPDVRDIRCVCYKCGKRIAEHAD